MLELVALKVTKERCEFKRIFDILSKHNPGRVHGLMECTPMLEEDKKAYDIVFGTQFHAFELCASWWTPVTRKRWWWMNFIPIFPPDVLQTKMPNGIIQLSFRPEDCPVRHHPRGLVGGCLGSSPLLGRRSGWRRWGWSWNGLGGG